MRSIAAMPALALALLESGAARAEISLDDRGVSLVEADPPARQSHLLAAIEVLSLDLAMNLGANLAARPWARIDLASVEANLRGWPILDRDPFTIDQLAHPWCGAMLFSAARSTGHGFWSAAIYTFAGSAVWEAFLENEPPSLNDQLTTPFGGALLGEAFHRFGRALLAARGARRSLLRQLASAVVDPIGMGNRVAWGDAWLDDEPQGLYAHAAIGVGIGSRRATSFHLQFVAEHGLTGDASFEPRRPFDHFEFRAFLDASGDDVDGALYMRGLALGIGFGSAVDQSAPRLRGIAGLFGAYDISNEARVRHSALGGGPGATATLRLGERGYLQTSVIGYLVPWGAAGGETEDEGPRRDYHHGPGLAALAELVLGHADAGELRATARAYRIQGTWADDPANETVTTATVSGRLSLAPNHALLIEAALAANGSYTVDRASTLRLAYVMKTDGLFSHSPRRARFASVARPSLGSPLARLPGEVSR